MAEVKWIKLATNVFNNRKIKLIESMPEGDTIIVIWFKLLMLAGEINDEGNIYFTKELAYTDQMLATVFDRPIATIQLALKTFEEFGMIEIIDNIIHISNWEKYQNVAGLDRIKEQTRQRVSKHRERARLERQKDDVTLRNVTYNATVTQCNATDIDIEEDKDIDKDIPPLSPQGEGWEKKSNKDNLIWLLNNGYAEASVFKNHPKLYEAVKSWMEYKDARKPKSTHHYASAKSMTTLLNKIVNSSKSCGADAVVNAIEDSIGNNYSGIVWDKIPKKKNDDLEGWLND